MNTAAPERALGGELEIPLETLLAEDGRRRIWPFEHMCSVTSGRSGLAVAERMIRRLGPVLLPAYICGAALQPFREAARELAFYAIDDALRPDADDLLHRLRTLRPAAVVAVAYFGFPVDPVTAEALGGLPDDVLLIEDCVQGSLVELPESPVGRLGDVAVTSFRKYLPVPDGGLVVARTSAGLPDLPPASNGGRVAKLAVAKALRAATGGEERAAAERAALTLVAEADRELDEAVPCESASALTQRLLPGLDVAESARRRRENYRHVLSGLEAENRLRELFVPLLPELPEGVSPLTLTVRVADGRRDAVRAELARRRVFCPVHWPLPPEVSAREFPAAHLLSGEMLGLPIDQRYGRAELDTLLDRLVDVA